MFYTEEIRIEEAGDLLSKCDLSVPSGVDYTAGVFDDNGKLVATGSLKGDMIQGIAVDPDYQGEDLTGKVFTHLVQVADRNSLYLFTKPGKVRQFEGLGMRHVATARPYAALLEWGAESLKTYQQQIIQISANDDVTFDAENCMISALVMNCNPFTKGHRYLAEKASRESGRVFLFVVEENASLFSFADRIEMVKMGTADLENVTVIPGGRYIISNMTFPSYFTKEENVANAHAAMDAEIFASCIAPVLNVNRRYVGTEPFSPVTCIYNEELKKRLPKKNIEVVEVPRIEIEGSAVSASRVRNLVLQLLSKDESQMSADEICMQLSNLLPLTTLEYIMSPQMEAKLCRALNYGEERWK